MPIQGGTDVMVALNFDHARPEVVLNLNEVEDLRGWSRANGSVRLGAALTYTEALREPLAELLPALAEASRTVGSPKPPAAALRKIVTRLRVASTIQYSPTP